MKRSQKRRLGVRVIAFAITVCYGFTAIPVFGLPTGATVTAGQASLSKDGAKLTVNQSTTSATYTWRSFNVGAGETVRFNQPTAQSVALNYVLGGGASQIDGTLSSNGILYLSNPNGFLFGRSAQVNVAGLTLDAGKSAISNAGRISVGAGNLIANGGVINNSGLMEATSAVAQGGSIVLTASQSVGNSGVIDASGATRGGSVALSGNSSVANAGRIVVRGASGNIKLLSSMATGTVTLSGALDASAPARGDGGQIEMAAAKTITAATATVSTRSATGKAGTWLIEGNNFTIGTSGDIAGSTLSSQLENTNVSIVSGSISASSGDLRVNDPITWAADTVLSLAAARDVNIDKSIVATGNTAGLVLAPGVAGHPNLNNGSSITLSGVNPSLNIAGNAYTIINSIGIEGDLSGKTLQGMNGNLSGYYALGSDLNATLTSTWNGGAGFAPIGGEIGFTGTFDGLGHSISNLTINRPESDAVGLFGINYGPIRNVGLVGGSVVGNQNAGALAGVNSGNVTNAYAKLSVSGGSAVGGLIGFNRAIGGSGGNIVNSYATGAVTGLGDNVGGFIGYNFSFDSTGANITNAFATGTVVGNNRVGGLIGNNSALDRGAAINNSYANGAVLGNNDVGGLVGNHQGDMSNNYATGNVSGAGDNIGGLVGYNLAYTVSSNIDTAFATGAVSGRNNIGGLVGFNNDYHGGNPAANITNAHATGTVSGNDNVGGLVGTNRAGNGITVIFGGGVGANITDAYATGAVNGTGDNIGGLVGYNSVNANTINAPGALIGGNITNTFASGAVTGGADHVGGLVGHNDVRALDSTTGGNIVSSYSTGTVTGAHDVGGLIGFNQIYADGGKIASSYSTSTVQGVSEVGGLVGLNLAGSDLQLLSATGRGANIDNVHATGAVKGLTDNIGGLVGLNQTFGDGGNISNAHASGEVSGELFIGGLVGANTTNGNGGIINNVYATGTVSGTGGIGGLIGGNTQIASAASNGSNVSNAYATGKVTGLGSVGGLVGSNRTYGSGANINLSYSTGEVTGASSVGGLVGSNIAFGNGGNISDAYASGATTATGDDVGGLIGRNSTFGATGSNISHSYATGTVIGANNVGGLVGYSHAFDAGANISNSYATGAVSGQSYVGGLVGTHAGEIIDSYANGDVVASGNFVGGLVGYNLAYSVVSHFMNVYATGSVKGYDYVGGLLGYNNDYYGNFPGGDIRNAYSTGAVSGNNNVGGLVGFNQVGTNGPTSYGGGSGGNIANAYATGAVTGAGDNIGGLIGYNFVAATGESIGGNISNAFATGNVVGAGDNVGGLIGNNLVHAFGSSNGGNITNAYATGAVSGHNEVGGLVGSQFVYAGGGKITNTYATGSVTGSSDVGAFAGFNGGSITSSYWNASAAGDQPGVGSGFSAGLVGLTTTQMMDPASFSGWSIDSQGNDPSAIWRIYPTYTAPLLKTFLTPIAINANDVTKTYDGNAWNGPISVRYGDIPDNSKIFGLPTSSGDGAGARNAGVYAISVSGLFSNQLGYDIIQESSGTLTVNKAPLSVIAKPITMVYGSSSIPDLPFSTSGLIGSDTADTALTGTLSTTAAVYNGQAGSGSRVGSYAILQGTLDSGNYALNFTGSALQIVPAVLTVSANSVSMTYGGNSLPTLTYASSGLVNGDSGDMVSGRLATNATAYNGRAGSGSNAGTYAITQGKLTSISANYIVDFTGGILTVNPAPIVITADNKSMTYGANAFPTLTFDKPALVNGDSKATAFTGSLSVTGVNLYDGRAASGSNAGIYSNAITQGSLSATNGNYLITFNPGTLTVKPAPLTVTANSQTMVYGSTMLPTLTYGVAGLVNGDSATNVVSGALDTKATAFDGTPHSGSNVGVYKVKKGTLTSNSNYSLTFLNLADGSWNQATVTVIPATLTYLANPASGAVGKIPTLSGSVVGLVNGDRPNSLSGTASWTTTATRKSVAGTYSISGAGLSSANYVFVQAPTNSTALTLK